MQTVYQTETAKAKVCFVVVPEDSDKWTLMEHYFGTMLRYRTGSGTGENLVNTNWNPNLQLIGPLSEVSEEQAAQLVDQFEDVMYGDVSPLTWLKHRARSLGIPEGQNIVVLTEFIS